MSEGKLRCTFSKDVGALAKERKHAMCAIVFDGKHLDPPQGRIEYYGPFDEEQAHIVTEALMKCLKIEEMAARAIREQTQCEHCDHTLAQHEDERCTKCFCGRKPR
jgi:hypothetical protein